MSRSNSVVKNLKDLRPTAGPVQIDIGPVSCCYVDYVGAMLAQLGPLGCGPSWGRPSGTLRGHFRVFPCAFMAFGTPFQGLLGPVPTCRALGFPTAFQLLVRLFHQPQQMLQSCALRIGIIFKQNHFATIWDPPISEQKIEQIRCSKVWRVSMARNGRRYLQNRTPMPTVWTVESSLGIRNSSAASADMAWSLTLWHLVSMLHVVAVGKKNAPKKP